MMMTLRVMASMSSAGEDQMRNTMQSLLTQCLAYSKSLTNIKRCDFVMVTAILEPAKTTWTGLKK